MTQSSFKEEQIHLENVNKKIKSSIEKLDKIPMYVGDDDVENTLAN
ncbi:hypothetical protein [Chengkuizengella axinellae]|uniref:Uncharacterized protein n=1 Tax=Chengkuizengella axinellae TaxID=3064388 RepID=A0ABT9J0V5_9BACL|nr:hypothetical protein [Chengkuizengella sp. 2205SS18-9]MDP5275217.1 hypothetical protein [Chengkuizengella sp. 2205SS18-9]